MPVSRNRKKKNINSEKQSIKNLFMLLDADNCKNCGGRRDEFSLEELSPEQQVIWTRTGMVDSIEYFLLCPECDELSAIFELEKL